MTGDLIVHRAPKGADRREGPLRILGAAEIPRDPVDAATVSADEGKALAFVLLHFLPAATIAHLLHTLNDAQVKETSLNGPT